MFRDFTDQIEEKTVTKAIALDSLRTYGNVKNEETGELDEASIVEPFAKVFIPTFDQALVDSYEQRKPRLGPQDPAYIPLWLLTGFKPNENKIDAKQHNADSPESTPLLDNDVVQVSDEEIESVAKILAETLVIYSMANIDITKVDPKAGLLGANRKDLQEKNPSALRILDTFIERIANTSKGK